MIVMMKKMMTQYMVREGRGREGRERVREGEMLVCIKC